MDNARVAEISGKLQPWISVDVVEFRNFANFIAQPVLGV
jgi:hypothetical protein